MNELLIGIVYVVFSYLYMFGYVVELSDKIANLNLAGWVVILFAPFTLPIALGSSRSQD